VNARICVDTAPFPDKYWAVEAGLGWQGKHTNVVSREFGSYLLLGSLIVDRDFDLYDRPHEDFCGTCDACLPACPTRAFPQPYVLDARRCLSYLTIEYKGTRLPDPPDNPSGWVFGCDDCLDACPWNRFATPARHPAMARREELALVESGAVRLLSVREFQERFAGSSLTRAGRDGLARNLATFAREDSQATRLTETPA
jgi:epoxyqueuosine reductase